MSFLRPVLIILVATWHHLGASQDIILKVVEPDPISQQSLCPNQRVVYKCGVVVVSFELSWTLVDKCSLKFTALSNTSDTDSKCDGKFNATLTHKRDISDEQTDGYLFNSTLEIFPPLSNSNGSLLMCTGGTVSKQVKDNATITLSGKPDPPTDLSYSLLESSVELKWNRPSYTGGNEILGMMYNVTANGKTYPVQNGSVAVKYTSPDLIYGDIKVTAINQCQQESMPAIVNIPTAAPPEPTLQPPVLYCDDTLSGGRRVDIKWMYGEMKEGVVYPGEVRVGLSLHPQAEGCSGVLEDATNCTAVITRDDIMYTINLTLSNDVAQTHPVMKMFESSPLKNETQPSSEGLIVTLTISETCRNAKYTLAVSFGARDSDGNYDSGKNLMMTSRNVVPGKPYSFKVNASVLELESGQVYCYNGSLLGSEGILYVASGCSEHKSSGPSSSGAQISGIILGALVCGIILGALACVVLLPLGVVAVVHIVQYFVRNCKRKALKIDDWPYDLTHTAGKISVDGPGEGKCSYHIRLDELDFGKQLGEGDYGTVYAGKWKTENVKVAIKECLNISFDAKILSELPPHEHVVRFHGMSPSENATYIVMELVVNGSLYDYIHTEKCTLDHQQAILWAKQIANGMMHLHHNHIVHRNLKSANVLISDVISDDKSMTLKVCDFGAARKVVDKCEQSTVLVQGMFRWMAPEIMRLGKDNAVIDFDEIKMCDVFSYGCVLYELFEKKLPYHKEKNTTSLAMKVMEGLRPAKISDLSNIPAYLGELMTACWLEEPRERPQFKECITALREKSFKQ